MIDSGRAPISLSFFFIHPLSLNPERRVKKKRKKRRSSFPVMNGGRLQFKRGDKLTQSQQFICHRSCSRILYKRTLLMSRHGRVWLYHRSSLTTTNDHHASWAVISPRERERVAGEACNEWQCNADLEPRGGTVIPASDHWHYEPDEHVDSDGGAEIYKSRNGQQWVWINSCYESLCTLR